MSITASLFVAVLVQPIFAAQVEVRSTVRIISEVPCLDENAVQATLDERLKESKLALLVMVVVRPAERGVIVSLRGLTQDGEVLLDRRFPLARSECSAAEVLLRTVLSTFLEELPKLKTPDPKPHKAPPPEAPKAVEAPTPPPPEAPRWNLYPRLGVSGDLLLAPLGADVAILGALGIGLEHRILTSASVRFALPRRLAEGRLFSVITLLHFGWAFAIRSFRVEAQLGLGPAFLAGLGFSENQRSWRLWLEGRAAGLYRLGPVELGFELTAGPLRYSIRDEEQTDQTKLSAVRLGALIMIPLSNPSRKD